MTRLQHTTDPCLLHLPDFKPLELSAQPRLKDILDRNPRQISGFTFAALYSWKPVYRYAWTLCGPETLLVSCQIPADGRRHFLAPVGRFEPDMQDKMLRILDSLPYAAKIFGAGADFIIKHPAFIARFNVENDPAVANYIYRAQDLAALAGKFYAKKRNLIAQAHQQYQYTVHKLTAENAAEGLDVLEQAESERDAAGGALQSDKPAAAAALADFSALGQQGILIRINGKAEAFSIFEPLNHNTAVIHFEKAERLHKGLYQIINQETAKAIAAAGFTQINREEDLGEPGLRQAKLSYGPVEIVPSYTLTFRPAPDNRR